MLFTDGVSRKARERSWLIDRGPIAVPPEVLEGIEAVRQSGEARMLDSRAVQAVARRMGYLETVRWIEDNPYLYIRGLVRGFVAEETR